MNVTVILPTYNERENITAVLAGLSKAAANIKAHTLKYLVVDDNSPDMTRQAVLEYAEKHRNVYLISGQKQGLGKALLRGMIFAQKQLKADILVQMDADLSHDPAVVPDLISKIDNGADFAVGSRYIPGGSIPSNWGIHRKIFSVVGNAIVRFGLGFPEVHDWTGGFRAYTVKFINQNQSEMERYSGYVFQIAFLHNAILNGAKVSEVPIHFTDRKFGRSKISPSEYIRNVLEYVITQRYFSVIHGTFGKFLVVGSIGFVINTAILELGVKLGYQPAIGSAAGAEIAILSNFILNNFWTFKSRRVMGSKAIPKFIQFNLSSIGAVIIQSGTVLLGTHFISLHLYRLWYILGVAIGLIWNYFMYSRVIWKKNT